MKFRKSATSVLAVILAIALCCGMLATIAVADDADGKYYPAYATIEEAQAAAYTLTGEITAEGDVLLKNNGLLPMNGSAWVSVFGVTADAMIGASNSSGAWSGNDSAGEYTLANVLKAEGFNVNPTLQNVYTNDESEIGDEITAFSGMVESSLSVYNDAAIIVLSREGGEGSDAPTTTAANGRVELAAPGEHLALAVNEQGQEIKHSLMLTDSEAEMIEYVKAHFDNVIIVLNTSNAMEVASLQNDDGISAIIDIGRPGFGGIEGLVSILNGTVNPSGAMIDEWMSDLTTDPTWYNFGSNAQNNRAGLAGSNSYMGGISGTSSQYDSDGAYHGVDYEEGIYLGYKYYETKYYDMYMAATTDEEREAAQQWWAENVTYAFGYGLSYTTFSFEAQGIYTDAACTAELGDSVDAAVFSSSEGSPAEVETLYVPVKVTNTGDVAGKKIVQVYVTAPYTVGGIEKSSVVLAGYAKTDIIAAGDSQTVVVAFNVQDFASWDSTDANADGFYGDYELDAGEYIVRVMESSHFDCATDLADTSDAYDQIVFTLNGNASLKLDDFSHNVLENLFSEENGTYDENTVDGDLGFYNIRTAEMMADGKSGMTVLSRADMEGTFPQAPTAADLTFKENILQNWYYWDNYCVSDKGVDSNGDPIAETKATITDESAYPWYKSAEDIPANWTQAAGVYDENHQVQNNRTTNLFPMYVSLAEESPIKFADMTGVAYDDPKWDEFLNQLTYDELCTLIEFCGYSTVDIGSVDKVKSEDTDGPNNLDSTHCWCSEGVISSTWNVVLAEKEGELVGSIGLLHGVEGWYGPGMDTHRSPFSGRNNEYYSQDGVQGGYIAAAVISGAESKGLICYVKHIFMNDQETNRGNLFTWATEQTMRENYAKVFQMALQEGDSSAAMVGYGRMGGLSNTNNYNLSTRLYQDQWGVSTYFVTDGYIGWVTRTDLDMMVRTGNLVELYTTPYVEYLSGNWDASKNMVVIGTGADAVESPTQWYCVRSAAKAILYKTANSSVAQNGYSGLVIADSFVPATQGVKFEGSVSIDALLTAGSSVNYSLMGQLPAGLEFNAVTGEISGTPAEMGEYVLQVNYVIDGYISKSATYIFNVESAFYMNEYGDDLDSAKVGQEFVAQVCSDIFTIVDGKYGSVVYTLGDGELPAGITIEEDGTISGTPEAAGTYTAVINMTAEEAAAESENSCGCGGGSGSSNEPTTTVLSYVITIVVSD